MINYNTKPVEELYSFQIKGSFDPQHYSLPWLVKNKIIDVEEMDQYKSYTRDEIVQYNSKILYFEIDYDYFKIKTYSSATYPILLDKFISILRLLRSTVDSSYSFRVNLHTRLRNNNHVKSSLTKFTVPKLKEDGIVNGSWSDAVQFVDNLSHRNFNLNRRIILSKCYKIEPEFQHNLHIFVINEIQLTKKEIFDRFHNDQDMIFKKSIEICNYLLNIVHS